MTTTSQALEVKDKSPANLVPMYEHEFSEVLPDHIKSNTFIRLAQAALRKNAELMSAATKDPGSLIHALREAARLGHEPGTPAFYLVPIGGKVEGWEGYRGVIERIYRAGAAASVVVELVRENDLKDGRFVWEPGIMDRPHHKPDWFSDRGAIVGAYAYAVMRGGAVSKVELINQDDIKRIRAEAKGAGRADSPWNKWEDRMVLKSVVHRLEAFVPTSSEYIREQLRAVRDVAAEPTQLRPATPTVDTATGEIHDDEIVVEAES